MKELKVEYVSLDSVKPYERNAKLHPEEQVEQIKKSIQQFGFNDPIALWHGEIVEGHGRLMAAKELGMATVPVIRLDELTDEQRRAYALAHNKLTMNSGFDFGLLEDELADLEIDMSDFGFYMPEPHDLEQPGHYESGFGEAPAEYAAYDEGYREAQEPLSKEELQQYSDAAENLLIKKRVIITYDPGDEGTLKQLLGIKDEVVRVVYELKDLI